MTNEEFKKKFTKAPFSIVLDRRDDWDGNINRDYYNTGVPIEKLARPFTKEDAKALYDRRVYELKRITNTLKVPIFVCEDDKHVWCDYDIDYDYPEDCIDAFSNIEFDITDITDDYDHPESYEECRHWLNANTLSVMSNLEDAGLLKKGTSEKWLEYYKYTVESTNNSF